MNHKEHKGHKEYKGRKSHRIGISFVLFVLFVVPTRFVSFALFVVPTWAQTQQAAPPLNQTAPVTRGNAETGRQTYTKKGCYACHGREGQGSPTTGPRLGPNPVPLATFTRDVRAPRGQMPPYSEKVVSDAELADMYTFLQARPGPAPIDSALSPK